jgi:hypothetical protein
MMIVNDDYRVINKLEASLTGDARVIINDHHMLVQAADIRTIRSGGSNWCKTISSSYHFIHYLRNPQSILP